MTTADPQLNPQERRLRNRSILLAVVCPVALTVWLPEVGEAAIVLATIGWKTTRATLAGLSHVTGGRDSYSINCSLRSGSR